MKHTAVDAVVREGASGDQERAVPRTSEVEQQADAQEEETLIRKLGRASGAADRPMGEAEPPAPFLITALSYVGILTIGVLLLAFMFYLWR